MRDRRFGDATRSTRARARPGRPPDLVKALGWDLRAAAGASRGEGALTRPPQRPPRHRAPRSARPAATTAWPTTTSTSSGAAKARSTRDHGGPRPHRRRGRALRGHRHRRRRLRRRRARRRRHRRAAARAGRRAAPRGRVSGRLLLQGPLTRPRVDGDAQLGAPLLRRRGHRRARGDAHRRRRRPAWRSTARCRSARVDLALRGSVGVGRALRGRPRARGASRRASTPSCACVVPEPARGRRHRRLGRGRADAVRSRPGASSRRRRAVRELLVSLPDYPVRTASPLRMRLAAGRSSCGALQLAGRRHRPAVAGTAALAGDGAARPHVRGARRPARALAREHGLRGRGGGARRGLGLAARARRRSWTARSTSRARAARARLPPRHRGRARPACASTSDAAQFAGVTGTLGGGASSSRARPPTRAGSLDVLRHPGHGPRHRPALPGGAAQPARRRPPPLRRRRAAVAHRHDRRAPGGLDAPLRRRLGAAGRAAGRGGAQRRPRRRRALDVKLRAPGTLSIDNNLATLQARADLTLQGSDGRPLVLGRAEIERGRVYFQGNTYVIRRGTIDFVNPQQLDPLFDIEAETRIRSYSVTLKVNGTLERVYPDPQLRPAAQHGADPEPAGRADESEVASLTQIAGDAGPGSRRPAPPRSPRAALGGGGPRARARSGLGLNRFSIDPSPCAARSRQPDRAPDRRQAHHARPQRALLAGPARHRGAPRRGRIHALRPALAAPHAVPDQAASASTCGSGGSHADARSSSPPSCACGASRAGARRRGADRGVRAHRGRRRGRRPGSRARRDQAGPAARPRARPPLGRADLRDRRLRGRGGRDATRAGRRGGGVPAVRLRCWPRCGSRATAWSKAEALRRTARLRARSRSGRRGSSGRRGTSRWPWRARVPRGARERAAPRHGAEAPRPSSHHRGPARAGGRSARVAGPPECWPLLEPGPAARGRGLQARAGRGRRPSACGRTSLVRGYWRAAVTVAEAYDPARGPHGPRLPGRRRARCTGRRGARARRARLQGRIRDLLKEGGAQRTPRGGERSPGGRRAARRATAGAA